ncbi:succinyldiaminopimelate transaminase [Arsenicicoccus sp. oral taxon 190]|uniref:succinyldiaminopimelate transaminase n=1 Tax=Arsenicicoccus sp. oral taxon 190 TaxID=1658671 RepID=UPI00067A35B5|nr:succinyldiaminopimelate transaminase [Arsenicicoccus sp. oral taxon 190]AKT51372.1 N-succinyldiaminopimelate aminotransferase [Arsenicicoccus sp. oral taxon 190]
MTAAFDLPDFPWDSLEPAKREAAAHPDGIVDLSVGTPVDATPPLLRRALADASDAHGYPQTFGTAPLREAVAAWFERRRGVPGVDPAGVLPTVGSKELVAWLPLLLGLGPGDQVGLPPIAYPTYDVGARLARAEPVVVDAAGALPQAGGIRLLWVNSPSNPTGAVHDVATLRAVVRWAREHGVVVASDECYAELAWDGAALEGGLPRPGHVPSILDPRVCEGSHEGLLACYSLSKQSNLAGYRAAFVAGDPALVGRLLELRKHAGMIVPWPVQEAMRVALGDDGHVAEQRARYAARRAQLLPALQAAGLRVQDSEAGLYLWSTRDEDCWDTVDFLARRGILVAPGAFYGAAGRRHVRIALTATDERIAAAVTRLTA